MAAVLPVGSVVDGTPPGRLSTPRRLAVPVPPDDCIASATGEQPLGATEIDPSRRAVNHAPGNPVIEGDPERLLGTDRVTIEGLARVPGPEHGVGCLSGLGNHQGPFSQMGYRSGHEVAIPPPQDRTQRVFADRVIELITIGINVEIGTFVVARAAA